MPSHNETTDALRTVRDLARAMAAAYDEAMSCFDGMPDNQQQIAQIRNEHRKQLADLDDILGTGPSGQDTEEVDEGVLDPGIAVPGPTEDAEQALIKMQRNDEYFGEVCRRALAMHGDSGIGTLLRRMVEEEERHARILERRVRNRVWEIEEPGETAGPPRV